MTRRFPGKKVRKKSERVWFRTTPAERANLLAAALQKGVTVSEIVREALTAAGLLGQEKPSFDMD